MSTTSADFESPDEQILEFFAGVFGITKERFRALGNLPEDTSDTLLPGQPLEMAGVMSPNNQPEFWADAPWRLEPDQTELQVTFYIRDANIDSPGYGPWRLDMLMIEQRTGDGTWPKLRTFLPSDLPNIDSQGNIGCNFWVFSTAIPISELHNVSSGDRVHLRVEFTGSAYPYVEKTPPIYRHLETLLAKNGLPQGRVECGTNPRKWFYGDTHYHSSYSNDIKEFGGAIPATRAAGIALGLDWLVVTDHSCDLDSIDADAPGYTRWERLKIEIAQKSDKIFRIILGEEITLVGRGDKFVHMLAMGGMQDNIRGEFLPGDSDNLLIDLCTKAIQNILRLGKGYPPETLQGMFGIVYGFEEVLAKLSPKTLTFAAHPYSCAQIPPAKWGESDLANLRLTGHEFWNTRTRCKASKTDDPFSEFSWSDQNICRQNDADRIQKLKEQAIQLWEPHLQQGVEEWKDSETLPSRRPVFIAGTDAHGDFNYHAGMAWDYSEVDMIDDNALGRVRTAIYLPENTSNTAPKTDAILAALKKGSCVVTDGPILEFSLQYNGQVAWMGDVLQIDGAGQPEMQIQAFTTPEFGPLTQAEAIFYFNGQQNGPTQVLLKAGKWQALPLAGERGYCRIQAQTVGADGEGFCCFTNPIWFRVSGGAQGEFLRATLKA